MSFSSGQRAWPDPHRPALVLTAVALGHALQINNGFYTPTAITVVGVSLAVTWAALLMPRLLDRLLPDRDGVVVTLLAAGLAWQLVRLMTSPIGMYLQRPWPRDHAAFIPLLILAAVAIALAVIGRGVWRRVSLAVLLATHVALGVITFKASPDPTIDVVTVHRAAFKAISHGRSPYSITFPDIYRGRGDFYPPGAVKDGIVHFGYPYPPASLLMAWPGEAWFKDFRYAELASLAAGAAFIALAGGLSRVALLAMGVLLFTPRVFFQLEQAWTEPLMIVWLGVGLWAWRKRWLGWALTGMALMVAVKQYAIIAIPLTWLMRGLMPPSETMPPASPAPSPVPLMTRLPAWLGGARAPLLVGLIAVATFVPFLLWDGTALIKSALLVQVNEKLRPDALSFAVTYAQTYGHEMSAALYGLIVLAALGLAAWRAPASPAGFSAALAVVLFTTFAFGKKAFCNYYFFVLAALCAAIAVARRSGEGVNSEHGI